MKLWNDEEVELEAYELGFLSWSKYINNLPYEKNPYIENSTSWFSWNVGWNLNSEGIE